MKVINKIQTLALLASLTLASTLSAKECINLNNVEVKWTSFKTLEKIGVSGTFKNVDLITSKNQSSINSALKGTSVKINLLDIDAKADIKTNNILKYFIPNLEKQNIEAKIVEVYKNSLDVEIYLNGKKNIIPMKYKVKDNTVESSGVIDALDFDLSSALKVLNTQVAGHLNKGWYDIPISFTLDYTKDCK